MKIGRMACAGSLAFALLASAPAIADEQAKEGVITAIMSISDQVDLLPGQAIIFKPEKGKLTMIRFVEGPMEPGPGELRLEFGEMAGQTSLIASSGADVPFNYRAEILKHPGAKKGKATRVCTIIAGGGAYETWPYAITSLRVKGFAPAPAGEMSCK
jgi:hypothetical protein